MNISPNKYFTKGEIYKFKTSSPANTASLHPTSQLQPAGCWSMSTSWQEMPWGICLTNTINTADKAAENELEYLEKHKTLPYFMLDIKPGMKFIYLGDYDIVKNNKYYNFNWYLTSFGWKEFAKIMLLNKTNSILFIPNKYLIQTHVEKN